MDIIVSCKNFALTPSLQAYAEDKVGKLGHFWERIIRARVELEVDKNRRQGVWHRATVTLEVPGRDITVTEEAGDVHAAIDLAIPVLERMLEKAKGKLEPVDWRRFKRARDKFFGWYNSVRGKF